MEIKFAPLQIAQDKSSGRIGMPAGFPGDLKRNYGFESQQECFAYSVPFYGGMYLEELEL